MLIHVLILGQDPDAQVLPASTLRGVVQIERRGDFITTEIPGRNSLRDRQSILAQATALGLKLSEDGQDWIPIETNSTNIPREGVQTLNVESEPSPVLPLLGAAAVGMNIGLSLVLMYLLASILGPILLIIFFFWLFLMAIGGGPIESMLYILDWLFG